MTLRERVSGETDSWSSWAHGKGGREKERGREQDRQRRERARKGGEEQPPYPPSGPLHCHPPLPKPPLPDPPGCKFLVCGPNTEIPNPSKSQAQLADSHTHMPPHLFTLSLVPQHTWFHLNQTPAKSRSSPTHSTLPIPIYPPSIYTYLPHLSLPFFLFHKATKALALVQSDMQGYL